MSRVSIRSGVTGGVSGGHYLLSQDITDHSQPHSRIFITRLQYTLSSGLDISKRCLL